MRTAEQILGSEIELTIYRNMFAELHDVLYHGYRDTEGFQVTVKTIVDTYNNELWDKGYRTPWRPRTQETE